MQSPFGFFRAAAPVSLRRLLRAASLGALLAAPLAPTAFAAEPARQVYRIEAGSLGETLSQFAGAAGVSLSFPPQLTAGKRSGGLAGAYTLEEGFAVLLAGSGLELVPAADGGYLLRQRPDTDAALLPTLRVSGVLAESAWGPVDGYVAKRAATATKTDTPIAETPQAINVVTADEIKARGAQTVLQALRYTPGVMVWASDADVNYDNVRVRGYANLGAYLDGMRLPYGFGGSGQLMIDPYLLERVEVLKGPASVLYGQSMPGGIVNQVSKRPGADAGRELQLIVGSHQRRQAQFDVGGALDGEGEWLYRLVGVGYDNETQVDHTDNARRLLAPSFTWAPGLDTRLTLLTHYQQDDGRGGYQFLPATGTMRPSPDGRIPRETYTGEPGYDRFEREQWSVAYLFEHRFNEHWALRQNFRRSGVDTEVRSSAVIGLAPGSTRLLNRMAARADSTLHSTSVDTQLEFATRLGEWSHTVLAGFDYLGFSERYRSGGAPAPALDIHAPVYGQAYPLPAFAALNRPSQRQRGLYLQDEIRYGRWVALLGGRLDWADSRSRTTLLATGTQSDSRIEDDSEFSGRAGLLYRFDNGFAPYVSYATSFLPTTGTGYGGEAFEPNTGHQTELGFKYEPVGGSSLSTVSVFDMKREELLTTDPDPSHLCGVGRCQIQAGEGRVRGVELETKTALTEALTLVASYVYTDAKYTKDHPNLAGASLEGNHLEMTPRHQASLWLDYRWSGGPLRGFGLAAGARHSSATYGDPYNDYREPEVTLFDLALSYDFSRWLSDGRRLQLSVNASNLTDKEYLSWCYHEAGCMYGQGRVVNAALTFGW